MNKSIDEQNAKEQAVEQNAEEQAVEQNAEEQAVEQNAEDPIKKLIAQLNEKEQKELKLYKEILRQRTQNYISATTDEICSLYPSARVNRQLALNLIEHLEKNPDEDWNTLLNYLCDIYKACISETATHEGKPSESTTTKSVSSLVHTTTTITKTITIENEVKPVIAINNFPDMLQAKIFAGEAECRRLLVNQKEKLIEYAKGLYKVNNKHEEALTTKKDKYKKKFNDLEEARKNLHQQLADTKEEKGEANGKLEGQKEVNELLKKNVDYHKRQGQVFTNYLKNQPLLIQGASSGEGGSVRMLEHNAAGMLTNGSSNPEFAEKIAEYRARLVRPSRLTSGRFELILRLLNQYKTTSDTKMADSNFLSMISKCIKDLCTLNQTCETIIRDNEKQFGCETGCELPSFDKESDDTLGMEEEERDKILKYVKELISIVLGLTEEQAEEVFSQNGLQKTM